MITKEHDDRILKAAFDKLTPFGLQHHGPFFNL